LHVRWPLSGGRQRFNPALQMDQGCLHKDQLFTFCSYYMPTLRQSQFARRSKTGRQPLRPCPPMAECSSRGPQAHGIPRPGFTSLP
jgi:hypothetical protein